MYRLELSIELEVNKPLNISSETRPYSAPPTWDGGCLASSSKFNSRGSLGSNANGVLPSESTPARQRRPASGKVVRPLPAIPSAKSPISSTRETTKTYSRIIRPLPTTPCQSPLYATTTTNTTPQTLSQPPSYTSSGSLTKSTNIERSTSESLPPVLPTISTKMAQPPPSNQPLEPEEPPTPQTQRRRRLSKLRRHFGESIPEEVVLGTGFKKIGEYEMYLKAAVAARKILEMTCGEDQQGRESQSEDEDEDDGEQGEIYWTVFRSEDKPRWVLERGCCRREEPDYDEVIKALRAL